MSTRITYAVTPEKTSILKIQKDETVGDILKRIQEKQKDGNLKYMFLEGCLINDNDILWNYHDPSQIYIVTRTSTLPKEFETFFTDETASDTKPKKSKVIDDSDVIPFDIPTPEVVKPSNKAKKFRVYTTLTLDSMIKGSLVDGIEETTNAENAKNIVLEFIKNEPKFNDFIENKDDLEVSLFLPGGVHFRSGTFEDWLDTCDCSRYMLYAVVTRKLGDLANQTFKQLCDCSSREMKLLLSPLCNSTKEGYTQIAALLGFFYYGGTLESTQHILRCLATITGFAPMINSLYTIMVKKKINGTLITSITAALQTFISQKVIGSNMKSAFSYTISFMSYISNFKFVNLPVPNLYEYEYKNEEDKALDVIQTYLKNRGHLHYTILWDKDLLVEKEKAFKVSKQPNPIPIEELNESLTLETSLKPVSPMTIPYLHTVSFVRTEKDKADSTTKVGLFIRKIPGRERIVEFINPEKGGDAQEIDYDDLAREIGDRSIDENIKSKGDTSLQQIIFVCLDTSTSMRNQLDGRPRRRGTKEPSRMALSVKLLELLMKRIYDFKIPTARGLIVFGEKLEIKSQLSVAEKDFIESVKGISPYGDSPIWDALNLAADEIIKYNPSVDGEKKHPKAQGRIILISDAEPTKSEAATKYSISQKLVDNNIILDVIMISTDVVYLDAVIASIITGGLSFQPKSEKEGIDIFENEGFLDVNSRIGFYATKDKVDENLFAKIEEDKRKTFKKEYIQHMYTDLKSIKNKYIKTAEIKAELSSAEYTLCYRKDERHQPSSICDRHILQQLRYIRDHPNEDIVVFTFHTNLEKWRVYIKGPDGTPYKNAWWHLYVKFPKNYPNSPPKFRFISIPYHPNVSSAGKVLCSQISDGYKPHMKIANMLVNIQNLFKTPDENYCLRKSLLDEKNSPDTAGDFTRKASNNTKAYGREDYHDFIEGIKVNDKVPGNYIIEDEDEHNDLFVTNHGDITGPQKLIGDDDDLLD